MECFDCGADVARIRPSVCCRSPASYAAAARRPSVTPPDRRGFTRPGRTVGEDGRSADQGGATNPEMAAGDPVRGTPGGGGVAGQGHVRGHDDDGTDRPPVRRRSGLHRVGGVVLPWGTAAPGSCRRTDQQGPGMLVLRSVPNNGLLHCQRDPRGTSTELRRWRAVTACGSLATGFGVRSMRSSPTTAPQSRCTRSASSGASPVPAVPRCGLIIRDAVPMMPVADPSGLRPPDVAPPASIDVALQVLAVRGGDHHG